MMQSLTEFMKKELIFYIKQEYDKGHSVEKIKNALLEGGHHRDLVSEAINALKKNKFNVVRSLDDPIEKHLDQELYFDIMNSLIRYIEYQLRKGYTPSKVKEILLDYGHSDEVISEALEKAMKKKSPKKSKNNINKVFELAYIILFGLLLIFVSGSTQEPLEIILFAFLPAILTIMFSYIILQSPLDNAYLWLAPMILSAVFGAVLSFNPVYPGMEIVKISVLNLLFGMIFVYILVAESFDQSKSLGVLAKEVEAERDKESKK